MDDIARRARQFIEALPHARALGMRLEGFGEGRATLAMDYDDRFVGDPRTGVIHGGAVSALMDTASGAAVMSHPAAPAATPDATVPAAPYDAAVSMHRAIVGLPHERRAQRLASPTPSDNRISYGCINVPATFFDRTLLPLSKRRLPVVYVLPETRPWPTIFGAAARPSGT